MRNLIIKRAKSFVGCLGKMKIYVEDIISGDTVINNTLCRKIGDLRNGEEKTFQIGEQALKVFVIADKLSKNFCNDYYQIPYGQTDVYLSGKNKFNPANGNAFRFDNNESEGVLANRKNGTKKGLLILLGAIVVGFIMGFLISFNFFSDQSPKEKVFSFDGMKITLTDEFKETSIENYTVAYDSKNIAVFVLKESFSLGDGFQNLTLNEYEDLVIRAASLSDVQKKTADGLNWFEYPATNSETGDTYRYFSYVYKTGNAFWVVQFATLDGNAEKYFPKITDWASSVVISD